MNGFDGQIRRIVEEWPEAGYVVGVLPDPADPEWSGRSVLGLIEAADREGGASVVVDLAPEATDLAARFEAGRGPGLAELAAGDVELWEISHRSDVHRAVYLGEGAGQTGADLAGSETLAELAGKMSARGRLLLVVLDRAGTEAASSAGYLDGLVRIGEAHGAGEIEGVPELGRVTARPGGKRPVPDAAGGPRLVLPPEMRSDHRRKRRIRRGLIGAAALIAAAVVASSLLGGPDVADLFSGSGATPAAVDRADPGRQGSAAAAAASDSPAGADAEDAVGPGSGEPPGGEAGGLDSGPADTDSAASPGAEPRSGGPPR